MSARYWRKLALLAKIETVYGTDATPTGEANAMLAVDVNYTPLEATEEERNLATPYMGHQGVILTGIYARIEFSIELAGAGEAGDVPAYGPLLRACGMAQTVIEEESNPVAVEYSPVSGAFEAVTFYYNRDGVKAVLLGARGTWQLDMTPGRIARFRFNFAGLDGTYTDAALPSADYDAFQTPVPGSKAATTFSLHGYAGPTESISIQMGNQIEPRMLFNEESIQQVDRRATGSVVMQAALLATKNWKAIAKSHQLGVMAVQHGTVAGNIVEIDAPAVQIGRLGEGQSQGIINNTLPLIFQPDEGNDELVITVR